MSDAIQPLAAARRQSLAFQRRWLALRARWCALLAAILVALDTHDSPIARARLLASRFAEPLRALAADVALAADYVRQRRSVRYSALPRGDATALRSNCAALELLAHCCQAAADDDNGHARLSTVAQLAATATLSAADSVMPPWSAAAPHALESVVKRAHNALTTINYSSAGPVAVSMARNLLCTMVSIPIAIPSEFFII